MSTHKDKMKALGNRRPTLHPKEQESFASDVIDLFKNGVRGGCPKWFYSDPLNEEDPARGSEIFERIAQREEYSARHEEADIFSNEKKYEFLMRKYKTRKGLRPITRLISYGGGATEAFRAKDGKVLDYFDIEDLVLVDISKKYLIEQNEVVQDIKPGASVTLVNKPFDEAVKAKGLEEYHNTTIAIAAGLTLFNAALDPNGQHKGDVREALLEQVKMLSEPLKDGDILVISTDANTDREKLETAYFTPPEKNAGEDLNKEWIRAFMHYIVRELPTEGFDPDNFEVGVRYKEERLPSQDKDDRREGYGVIEAFIKPRKTHSFKIAGQKIHVKKDQEFIAANSIKIDRAVFADILKEAGFGSILTASDNKRFGTAIHCAVKGPVPKGM